MEFVARSQDQAELRALPSVDDVLRSDAAAAWLARLPRQRVVELVREAISGLRADALGGRGVGRTPPSESITDYVSRAIHRLGRQSLRPVINASGVILHTNLGRAPLAESAIRAISETAGRYSNLEYDAANGRRGKRDLHCDELLRRLLGAPAIVVNNNAAAIFLVLSEIARGGFAIVSRGELIEIGDGFRIPEILEASQAELVEVGTTNRTRIEDYKAALDTRTEAMLRIHPSNFRMVGFTGRPSLSALIDLARQHSIPLIEDLGSGCLTDLSREGIEDEPPVVASLRAGVNLVTFSGDKLLGGPQAGIIAGDPELVARVRRNPLFRALRVDKLTVAALSATLQEYLRGNEAAIPAVRMLRCTAAEIAERAATFAQRLQEHGFSNIEVAPGRSLLGGGSTPMQSMETALVVIPPPAGMTASEFERALRAHDPPVVARIESDRVLLDLRTVPDTERDTLLAAVLAIGASRRGGRDK